MRSKEAWSEWGVMETRVIDLLDVNVWYQSHWNPTRYRVGIITGITKNSATLIRTDKVTIKVNWTDIYTYD